MTSLEFVEYADFSGGMNKSNTLDAIQDNEVAHLQDIIPGQAGAIFSRGTVELPQATSGAIGLSVYNQAVIQEPYGIFTTTSPLGVQRIGVVGTDSGGTSKVAFFADDFSSLTAPTALSSNYALKGNLPIVSSRPRLGGGVFVGVSNGYEQVYNNRNLAVWHGSNFATYSTGTIDYTLGSRTVTGHSTAWSTNVEPGMYLLHSNGFYLGMVVAVVSNTSITLDRPVPASTAAGQTYSIKAVRGANINVGGGLITTATDSPVIVGSQTSFLGSGLWANTWSLFRASDWAYIGAVSSVSTDTTLTLQANAAIAMTNEAWVAVQTNLANSISFGPLTPATAPGFLTTTYAGRQWYANMTYADLGYGSYLDSAWFSEEGLPEVVNVSPTDGSRIQIQNTASNPNSGIRGFFGTDNGILVAKDRETHVILGDSPENFSNQKIVNDGCLGAGTLQGWQSGVVWAGWDGIWVWDGATPTNITLDRLGDWYKTTISGFMENNARAWGFVYRDYYVLHVEQLKNPVSLWSGNRNIFSKLPIFDNSPTMVLVIHIPTRAVGFLRGVDILGAVKYTGAAVGDQSLGIFPVWFGGPSNNATPGVGLYRLNNVFDNRNGSSFSITAVYKDPASGNWFTETSVKARPYIQTKAYDLGAPLIKKAWRGMLMHYTAATDIVGVVPVIDPDLSASGTAISDFASSTGSTVARTKYVRRSRKISYQIMGGANNAGIDNFTLKALGILFKRLPVGRS